MASYGPTKAVTLSMLRRRAAAVGRVRLVAVGVDDMAHRAVAVEVDREGRHHARLERGGHEDAPLHDHGGVSEEMVDAEACMVKRSEIGDFRAAWLGARGLWERPETLGHFSRVRRAASGLQMQLHEPVVA